MLLASLSFWAPDTLLHAIRAYKFNSSDVVIVSIIMPASLLLALVAVRRLSTDDPLKHVGAALVGIWFLGGLFMMLGASFSGGGLNSPQGVRFVLSIILLSFFPPYTFMMATYDGALGALLFVTLVGLIVWSAQLWRFLWLNWRRKAASQAHGASSSTDDSGAL